MPSNPWHGYAVKPVAPTLRVEDLPRGLTADMVVPIAPNNSHPNGRVPIHTKPAFPFSNCYFWYQYERMLRVIARPEMFDHTDAVALDTDGYFQMSQEFRDDMLRSVQTRQQRLAQPPASALESQSALASQSAPDEADSSGSGGSSECADLVHPLDLFGDDADPVQTELLPLVDLWLDLTTHLTEDTIPNPEGLTDEITTILS